ncbi:hypothetical protein [uncultured Winogradskyella sp.]|uniref:hypothetical protein n=1 Tax=Winogradskyella sp. 4-2091 TaxID=3381659 RepID=UPI002604B2D2|nr:hypothetical protein [uncultured Winogradskyella sp.]
MYLDKPSEEESPIKKKRKSFKDYFEYGNSQINQVGLILFISFIISSSLIYVFDERFSEKSWKQSPMKRYQMVDDIIDRDLFINDSKQVVISKLGQPRILNSSTNKQYNYYIGTGLKVSNDQTAMLSLIFQNNKVIKVLLLPSTN